jgi:choline dehydrogenase
MSERDFEYIVIGSGAGGGPLAANLARAGFRVLLMEAGGDSATQGDTGRYLYEVPIFHGLSTEHPDCEWDFFVRHFSDTSKQRLDSKFVADEDGVWYPRAGTLGGCTAHNAMITVIPQDGDWNHIAQLTGDDTWNAKTMNAYFARMENCHYRPRPGSLTYVLTGMVSSLAELIRGRADWRDWRHGHGFKGWLTTSEADPLLAIKDPEVIALLSNAIKESLIEQLDDPVLRAQTRFDPNDSRNREFNPEGLAFTPLAVDQGKRNGPREYVLRTRQRYPNNLTILLNSLATRIVFDGSRAVGVDYLDGPYAYQASPKSKGQSPPKTLRRVTASREVIVAAGAFNSPQLLMLSGVGPKEQLQRFDIPIIVDLPGVGANLQDRYEVGVISEWKRPFSLLDGATFEPPEPGKDHDPYLRMWEADGKGIYASNGALIGIIKKSTPDRPTPDLYVFGLPGYFKGYEPGYSTRFERFHDRFTWAILKAHTNNTAGKVSLRSSDPCARPLVEFRYFSEGNDATGADLDAVVAGVDFVRGMNQRLMRLGLIGDELAPGPQIDDRDKLRHFIQNEAWGHHASCTNKIGADNDPMAVLDSRFKVRQTQGLRVVDASSFPRIPGYFIVSAIYMISEKASDVIIEDAQSR